jgi:hypothetical protein
LKALWCCLLDRVIAEKTVLLLVVFLLFIPLFLAFLLSLSLLCRSSVFLWLL